MTMHHTPDQHPGEWADRIQDLYRKHRDHLLRFARRQLAKHEHPSSAADAEDIVQQAFVAALATWPTMTEHLGNPLGWLHTVVVQKCRDLPAHVRRSTPVDHAGLEPASGLPRWTSTSAVSDPQRAAEADAVMGEILRLPDTQREAVLLRIVADWSYASIATAMDIEPSTARVHVFRGRRVVSERQNGAGLGVFADLTAHPRAALVSLLLLVALVVGGLAVLVTWW
ncbi:RNA polymerase sigma factor [Streptomyces sp. NBC_00199]|uniref:RNA polymerase sigma factor n=1 Tax=Streptomyces sp. NBC_00199 TaxID=2975678 RepID=UPI00224D2964|nr:RNA polymerase sigma factor [Streptomyces sp. NBC_00199]MCX5262444.1 RNA polymerase sigma factor [Streptomyces sp. NBC_00199]